MTQWIKFVPLLSALSALVSGCCSTSSGGFPENLAKQSLQIPVAFKKGKLIVDNSLSPNPSKRFDESIVKGVHAGWDALPFSGTGKTIDCKFSYENKDTSPVLSGLTLVMYGFSLGTIPWRVSSDITCSAQITVSDESGRVIKTSQTERVVGKQNGYMSILPTSWLVKLFSPAPICRAGTLGRDINIVSEEMGIAMFRAVVIDELNRVARENAP